MSVKYLFVKDIHENVLISFLDSWISGLVGCFVLFLVLLLSLFPMQFQLEYIYIYILQEKIVERTTLNKNIIIFHSKSADCIYGWEERFGLPIEQSDTLFHSS